MEDEDHTHQDIETGEDLGPEKQLTLTDPMLQGTICFSWEDGRFLKKVPYFIVPDGWENDPALLDRVVQGMNLTMPNMVLNFNPVKEPISRWNKEWDYWSPAADSVWEVDEDILPLVLPAGQSTGVKVCGSTVPFSISMHLRSQCQADSYRVLIQKGVHRTWLNTWPRW